MKVLVTGGSGYFGSLLIDKLLSKGYEVGSLDINKPDTYGLRFHQMDIRDSNKLYDILKGYDIIFHNVAQVPLAKDKKLFWDVNVEGTRTLCEIALRQGVKKLIYTSSSAIYGVPKNNPVDENTIPSPGEHYGKAKLEGEKICKKYSNRGLQVSIIRPRTILGHGRLGIFSILFKWLSEGVDIPVLNNGDNVYQFVHADDLADACILASEKENLFSTYNIGAADFGTMRQTLEHLCEYADTGSKVYSLPLRPVEIGMNILSKLRLIPLGPYHSLMYGRSLYFNINKAIKDLNFKPQYSTDEMFRESYDWYLSNYGSWNDEKTLSAHRKPTKEAFLKILKWLS